MLLKYLKPLIRLYVKTLDKQSEALALSHITNFQNKKHFYITIILF